LVSHIHSLSYIHLPATHSGGAVLLDVRLINKYEASHAAGSLSTPLYNPIQKWDLPSILRRAGFAFFGIYGTGALTGRARWHKLSVDGFP
jgi:hypothetical protein